MDISTAWAFSIPHIIRQELLNSNEKTVASWNVTQWKALAEDTLGIRVQTAYLDGIVCITLDDMKDSCIIKFFKNKDFFSLLENAQLKYTAQRISCSQLLEFIDYTIAKIPDYKL